MRVEVWSPGVMSDEINTGISVDRGCSLSFLVGHAPQLDILDARYAVQRGRVGSRYGGGGRSELGGTSRGGAG